MGPGSTRAPFPQNIMSRITFPRPALRAVFFDGPQPDRNHDGDEIPTWSVYVGDEEGIPVDSVYRFFSFGAAERLAQRIADDRGIELIVDAMPA